MKLNISPARVAAFEILLRIEKDKSFSSILLPIYEENLETKNRGLCHELTLGVLRKQLFLDKIIENFTNKKLDREVRIALRLGIYQLLFLNKIPAYSAINESVNLVIQAKKTSAKGFVNAILRRVTREKIELNFNDQIEKISVETSHPRWLIEKWNGQFGIIETEKLALANNELPEMDFRLTKKTTESIENSLKQENIKDQKTFLRNLAEHGKIYFQDEASQLVGKAVDLRENEKFFDVCSAPGSKLTQIATISNQMVIGGDLFYQRVRIIKKIAQKQGLQNISLLQYDAEKSLPFAEETFDVVLLDAPCSGTGTIRHNPEIRYHLGEKDFVDLSDKQLKILNLASKVLKRGGRLIYSTCSLEKEENEDVIQNFLNNNPHFTKVANKPLAQFQTKEGFIRTYPHLSKMDGFFIAELRKV